jgi:protease-4
MRCMLATSAVLALLVPACGPLTFTVGGSPGNEALRESVVESDGTLVRQRVALIEVSGLLTSMPRPGIFLAGESPPGLLHEKLRKAQADGRVKAIVLRLNTPGGTVTASETMYSQLQRFKQQTGKPIVVLMMDVAASGGYYMSCAADHIIARPTSVTGSIGVLIQTISLKTALDRLGVEADAITSGPNKAAGSPLGRLTDEHRQILAALVDDFYARFTAVVRAARPQIPSDQFARVTDGRVYSGEAALQVGLVDQVGDLYDAFEKAKALAGIARAKLVIYHRASTSVRSTYAEAHVPTRTQINLAQINFPDSISGPSTGFYYLWRPDVGGGIAE